MGRPREFDEAKVLRQATRVFGQQGFDAISVDALLKALGMNRASFYKLFGSKHGLARAALEQVCERALGGDIDSDSKDFTIVALVELATVSDDMRQLVNHAADQCFASDPTALGQHILTRANRPTV